MGLRDKQLMLSDAQAVTTAAATPSSNYLDLLANGDLAIGNELWILGAVNTTVTSGGAANVTIKIEVDDNTSFSSATTLITTAAIAKATLVAGYWFLRARLPVNPTLAKERYLRAVITPDTNDLTAGKFDIWLALGADLQGASGSPPYARASYPQA